MISCKKFYDYLLENDINFFTGVPDSLLKDFCAYVTDNTESRKNIITANEGNAIAIASGHYLATGSQGRAAACQDGKDYTRAPANIRHTA